MSDAYDETADPGESQSSTAAGVSGSSPDGNVPSDATDSHGAAHPRERKASVFCVGNRLMLDEGIGPAVFDEICEHYIVADNVTFYDVGCMSMDMLPHVESDDFILTVDAVDGTGDPAGTVYRFQPDDMARHSGATASLHDLKLIDLFDAATLLGYEAEGLCLGMQVQNMYPEEYVIGLTPPCHEALPLLIETVVAELNKRGFDIRRKQ